MSAFHYFDSVYVIHMPDPERRVAIDEELTRVGLLGNVPIRYVYAARPRSPFSMSNMRRAPIYEFAVNLSHIKAVAHAIADNAKTPLFIEDDIVFAPRAGKVLKSALDSLPKWENQPIWSVMYLGGHPCEDVERIGENLVKVGRFSFAEAYTFGGRAPLIDFLMFWLDNIGQDQAMYDFILSRFAMTSGYCTYPVITNQPPGYSHIAQAKDDKTRLVERGWQNHI